MKLSLLVQGCRRTFSPLIISSKYIIPKKKKLETETLMIPVMMVDKNSSTN